MVVVVVGRTAFFGVVVQLGSERFVLRVILDGLRQVVEPVGVFRDANALLRERALVDLEADQREDGQHEDRQNADVAQSPDRFQQRAYDRLQT